MSDGTASNAKLNVDTSPLESTGTLTNPYSNCETYRGCGPTHLTGHHPSPLGHSEMHSHYIKPVPPMYVTEYEAAYNDPRFANDNFNLSPKSSMSSGQESSGSPLNVSKHLFSVNPLVNPPKPKPAMKETKGSDKISGSGGSGNDVVNENIKIMARNWESAIYFLNEISALGFEKSLISGVLPKVQSHSLDSGIEYCYEHLKSRIEAKDVGEHLSDAEKRAYDLAVAFVECVNAIKQVKKQHKHDKKVSNVEPNQQR